MSHNHRSHRAIDWLGSSIRGQEGGAVAPTSCFGCREIHDFLSSFQKQLEKWMRRSRSRTLPCFTRSSLLPFPLLVYICTKQWRHALLCKKLVYVSKVCGLLCFRCCRPLALGNTADAVEILSAGYILGAFRQEDGGPLNSTQKGKKPIRYLVRCHGLGKGNRMR